MHIILHSLKLPHPWAKLKNIFKTVKGVLPRYDDLVHIQHGRVLDPLVDVPVEAVVVEGEVAEAADGLAVVAVVQVLDLKVVVAEKGLWC